MTANSSAHAGSVLVVGSNMVDLLSYLERVPERGETVLGRGFHQGFGGKGANQACMAAALGTRVEFVGCLGDDLFAPGWMKHLHEFGVATTHLHLVKGEQCGVAAIWVEPDGANRIALGAGANTQVVPELVHQACDALMRERKWDVVLSQLEISQPAVLAAFQRGRAHGAVNILNPGPAARIDDEILALTDWLIPNETELALLASEHYGLEDTDDLALARQFSQRAGVELIVTLGGRGAALLHTGSGRELELFSAPKVDALDTTGAGDCFVGAFAAGIAKGWTPSKSIRAAISISSDSVQRSGTSVSYPRGEALAALIDANT